MVATILEGIIEEELPIAVGLMRIVAVVVVLDCCFTVKWGFLMPPTPPTLLPLLMPLVEGEIFLVVRKVFSLLESDDWRLAGM